MFVSMDVSFFENQPYFAKNSLHTENMTIEASFRNFWDTFSIFESSTCGTPTPLDQLNSVILINSYISLIHLSNQELPNGKSLKSTPLTKGNKIRNLKSKIVMEEIKALEKNGTWECVSIPNGKKIVGCKCVFTMKYNSDGSIERFKAHLVTKGFTQSYGIDYQETFAQ